MKDLIYIKHPIQKLNVTQSERLAGIKDPADLAESAYLFNVGNATYRYYELGKSQELTPELHAMWLEGLEEPMKSNFTKNGFEKNRGVLSFIRFVNEMADIGMDEYVMKMLNEEHRQRWKDEI